MRRWLPGGVAAVFVGVIFATEVGDGILRIFDRSEWLAAVLDAWSAAVTGYFGVHVTRLVWRHWDQEGES